MPAGITVVGDHGLYQIDDTAFNLSLVAKGSTTLSGPSYEVFRQKDLFFTGLETPLLALHAPSVYADAFFGTMGFAVNNGQHLIRVAGYALGDYNAPWPVDYYLFDRPKGAPSGQGYGIEVFDTQGKLKFSSANPPMRLVGVTEGTYPAGRKYAIGLQCDLQYREESESRPGTTWHQWIAGGTRLSGASHNIIGYNEAVIDSGSGSAETAYNADLGICSVTSSGPLVIDVTGY